MITLVNQSTNDGPMDAVILAGGRLPEDLALRSETAYKALLPIDGVTSIHHTFRAVRDSKQIGRIAIVGPGELGQIPEIAACDLFMPESDSMEANLFTVFARLLPEDRILVMACDIPLVTAQAIDDLISRSAREAAVNVPWSVTNNSSVCFRARRVSFFDSAMEIGFPETARSSTAVRSLDSNVCSQRCSGVAARSGN